MLGSTVAVIDSKVANGVIPAQEGIQSNNEGVSLTGLTLFGEQKKGSTGSGAFFTGKPKVEELGYTFLFRNYKSSLNKWQTADPLGYPDGLNNFAYVNNGVSNYIDPLGLMDIIPQSLVESELQAKAKAKIDAYANSWAASQAISSLNVTSGRVNKDLFIEYNLVAIISGITINYIYKGVTYTTTISTAPFKVEGTKTLVRTDPTTYKIRDSRGDEEGPYLPRPLDISVYNNTVDVGYRSVTTVLGVDIADVTVTTAKFNLTVNGGVWSTWFAYKKE